jgi:hypothetical protein
VIASERTEKKTTVSSEDQSNAFKQASKQASSSLLLAFASMVILRVVSFGESLGTDRKENTTFAQQRVLRTDPKEKTTPL